MTSPYFQKINFQQPDFSPIVRGAEAYGQAFYQIGDAIGKLGSAYFERKGMENSAKKFLLSPAGPKYLKEQAGWDDQMIAEMQQDPKKAEKYVYDAMREGGGAEKFKQNLREAQREQRMIQQFQNAQQVHKQTLKQLKMSNAVMQEQADNNQRKNRLLNNYFQPDEEGNVVGDVNNILTNLQPGDGPVAHELLKTMGQKNLNIGGFLTKLQEQDPDIFTYPKVMDNEVSKVISMFDMSAEDQSRVFNVVKDRVINPTDITKTATEYWDTDPMNKRRLDVLETSDGLMVNINTALGKDESGKYFIQNTPSAGTAVRGYARVANGAGVMTDQDVLGVGGPKNYNAWWNRFTNQFFGEVEREATQQDVDLGYADRVGEKTTVNAGATVTPEDLLMMKEGSEAIVKLNNKKLQDAGVATQEHLQSTYTTVSSERLLQLNPYAEYFNDAYRIDVADSQWPQLQRLLQDEGEDAFRKALFDSNDRMSEGTFNNILERVKNMPVGGTQQPATPQVAPSTVDPQPADVTPEDDSNKTSSTEMSDGQKVLATAGGGAVGGAVTNLAWKSIYAGANVVGKGKNAVKNIASNARLTESAKRLLPQKMQAELRKNPFQVFDKFSGKHGPLGPVAKKLGIAKADEMSYETLEKRAVSKIKGQLKDKLASRGGNTALAKLAKVFAPDKLAKRLVPYAGWSLYAGDVVDVMDVVLDEVSVPSKVKKLEQSMKTVEAEMLSAGANPLEVLLTAQAFEQLIKEAQAGTAPSIIRNDDLYMDSSSTGVLKQNLGSYFK